MRNDHILIVGSGFAGLAMAIRLKQSGIEDFTLIEQASDVGGTWRANTYPGAACDVESYLYSYSFEPNPNWSRRYAPQREILDYIVHCVDKYELRSKIRFNTAAKSARFDEATGLWTVDTSDGNSIVARVLVSGCGGLSRPALPEIAGLNTFAGEMFHTARWNHDYSLAGKTVAVIGTGASAIQIVPAIAPAVGRLHLYQRTAHWIMPKPDRAVREEEIRRFRRTPILQRLARLWQYWRNELFAVGFVVDPRWLKLVSKVALKHLEAGVPDEELRAKMTPNYTMGCKRILLSNDFYQAVGRDNVDLITDEIAEIRPHSIVTRDGQDRAVDAIVLATGFHAADAAAPFRAYGLAGRELSEVWREGAEAYLGTTVAGFPNLFLLVGPNTGLGHSSMIFMIESQVEYVLGCVRTMREQGLKLVNVRQEVQERYNRKIAGRLRGTVWSTGCTSWYMTSKGKNTTLWPGFTFEFRMRTRHFDSANYDLVSDEKALT